MDSGTHAGDAGRVGAGEIVAVTQRHLGVDFDLAADVAHEGLVGDGVGGDTGQGVDGVAHFAAVLGIAHVAGEVNNDATTVRIGNIKAFNLSAGSRNSVHDLRNRKVGFVDFKTVGRGV